MNQSNTSRRAVLAATVALTLLATTPAYAGIGGWFVWLSSLYHCPPSQPVSVVLPLSAPLTCHLTERVVGLIAAKQRH